MPSIEFKQGDIIASAHEPLNQLTFIAKGRATAEFDGRAFYFEKGSALGICDISTRSHSLTYTAVSDVTIFTYPFDSLASLEKLFRENAEVANLLASSMCGQMADFLSYRAELKQEADSLERLFTVIYPKYERLCSRYATAPKKFADLQEILQTLQEDPVESWMHNYYMDIKNLDTRKDFFSKVGILLGFFHTSGEDILKVIESCRVYQKYLQDISSYLLRPDGHDILGLVAELHLSSINIRGADETITQLVQEIAVVLSKATYVDLVTLKERLGAYKDELKAKRSSAEIIDSPVAAAVNANLSDSLNTILDYAEIEEEQRNTFARQVREFANTTDRNGSDDSIYALRRALTQAFYPIYENVFIKSLEDPAPPTIIKMFLNFGYVDATLAGYENTNYMYSIADSLKGDVQNGVFTLVEWLTAVYNGDREPSRNEFDEDYVAHIREMRVARTITEKEEQELLKDQGKKLRFELENMFPVVNKITYGRIVTFCPLFGDHNAYQKLQDIIVTPKGIKESLKEITTLDYSAYYREVAYANEEFGLTNERINVEIMPQVILMPNVGIRGAMWQEIEGRDKKTSARMFLPMFYQGELTDVMMQLTAEYRWEICKRIQGTRWTDITEPSLTSEFFDYLQFYRSSKELSSETKVQVKAELAKAKNTYKSVFVANYMDWVLHESRGSQRLNKVARRVLINHCPFPKATREQIGQNPQYAESMKRFNIEKEKRVQRLQRIVEKITGQGKEVPAEIQAELDYTAR